MYVHTAVATNVALYPAPQNVVTANPLPPIEWLAGAIGEEERRKKAGSVPPAGDLHSC